MVADLYLSGAEVPSSQICRWRKKFSGLSSS